MVGRGKLLVGMVVLACSPAIAQLREAPIAKASQSVEPRTVNFRVGVVINANRGAIRDLKAMVAVPIECDEQTVKLVGEDFSSHVAGVKFRDLAGGNARQMLVSIPFLGDGEEARAALTYEVTTTPTAPLSGAEQAALRIPERVPRKLRGYLGPSPFIESKHPKIKQLARTLEEDFESDSSSQTRSDWRRLESVYDYVLDTIEYIEGDDTSALTTLEDASADCHGRSALFIALCRSMGVPSRMVWVQNHCYPEFYMEDSDAEGLWLPAESAGTRAFGEMPLARPIMQKGDDFRVPERKRERLRYATDQLEGRPTPGAGKPTVRYLREVVR